MCINHDFSSLKQRYLVVNILKPRVSPYFTNKLSRKLRHEANDGISRIIDLEIGSSIFLCCEVSILPHITASIQHRNLSLIGVSI